MTRQTIQAIRVYHYGGPEPLKLEQIPRPEPQAGEVLIQDWFPIQFPYIPGSAVAGVVEAIGPGVTRFQKGQAVFGRSTNGVYTEYATTTCRLSLNSMTFFE